MKILTVCLLLAGLPGGLLYSSGVPQEKKTRFSLVLEMTSLTNRHDETKTDIGAGALVIFSLGRRFMIMPEVFVGSGASRRALRSTSSSAAFSSGPAAPAAGFTTMRTSGIPSGC